MLFTFASHLMRRETWNTQSAGKRASSTNLARSHLSSEQPYGPAEAMMVIVEYVPRLEISQSDRNDPNAYSINFSKGKPAST